MSDARDRRIDELERCLRLCWGAMLLADTVVQDRNVRAAFRRVDAECKKTGLLAREGMAFVNAPLEGQREGTENAKP